MPFGGAAAFAPVTNLRGVSLRTYGDSMHIVTANQNSATVGQRLRDALGMTLTEGAVGGTQSVDVVSEMIFGRSMLRPTGTPALTSPADSSGMPALPFRGAVLIGTGTNDVAQYGSDTKLSTRVQAMLRCAIKIAQGSSTIVPGNAAFAYSAGWTTGALYASLDGTNHATTTQNSYLDLTFTGDGVTLLSVGAVGAGPTITASVGGVQIASWNLSNTTSADIQATGLGYLPWFPLVVKGLGAGSHTVRFQMATTGTEFDVLGAVVAASGATPPQVVLLKQVTPSDPWSSYVLAKTGVAYYGNGTDVGLANVNAAIAAVAAEVIDGSVTVVDPSVGFDTVGMHAHPYGAHWNDRGVAHVANRVAKALVAVGWRQGLQVIAP